MTQKSANKQKEEIASQIVRPTVETETKKDLRSTYERGPALIDYLGFGIDTRVYCPACLLQNIYSSPDTTVFHLICPPLSWVGSHAMRGRLF